VESGENPPHLSVLVGEVGQLVQTQRDWYRPSETGTELQTHPATRATVVFILVGEVARGLSLFGGASSEVRRCNCSVVVLIVVLSI
jgi:hypothetical protein